MYHYKPKGVCSTQIHFDVEQGKVKNVSYTDGCNGNLKGIGQLVDGMEVDDVIHRLDGLQCGNRKSSCPGQLAEALKQWKANQ